MTCRRRLAVRWAHLWRPVVAFRAPRAPSATAWTMHPSNPRLHTANESGMMGTMNGIDGRMVVVPAAVVDDLSELARLAADRLEQLDPALSGSLRGASAQLRMNVIYEP